MSQLGRKTPSISGSRASIYSHASTVRTLRTTGGTAGRASSHKPTRLPWWKKPCVSSAFYTDLQRGSWHIGFYTLFMSLWTIFTSGFDLYCLYEAAPGSNHTGYYIFSFDFVYVGNPHGMFRDLLVMSSIFSFLGGIALLITSVMLLDALRKEEETAFVGWLWVMAFFMPWKIVAWFYAVIVNDMIFAYNIFIFIAWAIFNVMNVFSFICIYSLYLELNDLTKLQDLARLKVESNYSIISRTSGQNSLYLASQPPSVNSQPLATIQEESFKMDTMSSMPASRAGSAYGSRPTSPYGTRDTLRKEQQQHAVYQYHQQQQLDDHVEPAYGYNSKHSDIV